MKKIDFIIYFLILIVSVSLTVVLKGLALVPLIVLTITLIAFFIFRNMRNDSFNIALLFILNYIAYVLYIPIKQLDKQFIAKAFPILADNYLGVQVLLVSGIVSLIAFSIGYSILNKEITSKKRLVQKKWFKKLFDNKYIGRFLKVEYLSNFILVFGLLIFIFAIYRQGGIGYIFSKYQWDSNNDLEIGFMTTGVQIIIVGISMSFYIFLDKHQAKSIFKCPQLYIFLLIGLIKLMQGGRIQILMGAITLIMLYHYKRRKISIKFLAFGVICGYMLLGFIGYFRDYKSLNIHNYKEIIRYVLGGSGGLEYYLNSYTIFSTMYVITTRGISYIYGASLIDGITFLIPRFIFPTKESHLFLMNKVEEISKVENISPLGGLNLASQNLVNGYIIFTFIFMLLIGLLLRYLYLKCKHESDMVLLYCLIAPFIIVSMVRNPIYYSIKELIQFALVPYIIFRILKMRTAYEEDYI